MVRYCSSLLVTVFSLATRHLSHPPPSSYPEPSQIKEKGPSLFSSIRGVVLLLRNFREDLSPSFVHCCGGGGSDRRAALVVVVVVAMVVVVVLASVRAKHS